MDATIAAIGMGVVPRLGLLVGVLIGVLFIGSVLRGGLRRGLLLGSVVLAIGAVAFLFANRPSHRAGHVSVAIDACSEETSGITGHVFDSRFGGDDMPGEGRVFDT
ncbi:MAG: hypothetical protein ACE5GE_12075, partial [Phycisphaerae bacterium]